MEATRLSQHLAAAAERITRSHKIQTALENHRQFLEGSVTSIFGTLSEDIVWTHAGDPQLIPFAGTFYGKKGVADFFETVGQTLLVNSIQPYNITEEGNTVTHNVTVEATALPRGKGYCAELHLTWVFDPAGKIARLEVGGDLREVEEAFRADA